MTICCTTCYTPFGESDGATLRIGNVIIVTLTVLRCATCGAERTWYPPRRRRHRRKADRVAA